MVIRSFMWTNHVFVFQSFVEERELSRNDEEESILLLQHMRFTVLPSERHTYTPGIVMLEQQ